MSFLEGADAALEEPPSPIYAATVRLRYESRRRLMDSWYEPLTIGAVLPTLPLWLKETLAISLDLEANYEETCRALRIR